MSAIQVPVIRTTDSWSLSTFFEGPRTLNEKITGVVLAALAALASFLLLPRTAASVITGALAILCAAFCGIGREENSTVLNLRVPLLTQPGYAVPNAIAHVHPVHVQPVLNSAPQRPPARVAANDISLISVNGQPQAVADPGPRMVAGSGQIAAPQRPPAGVAANDISLISVNGQPQAVADPGPRMVAGSRQIAAPQRPPAGVAASVYPQPGFAVNSPPPPSQPAGNRPRAPVGHS